MNAPLRTGDGRHEAMLAFLAAHGWPVQGPRAAELQPLAGDASFRRYWRLRRGADRVVLMDAPPPMEDVRPYSRLARHLLALGFSAPEILAEDAAQGFLLIEDFGDDTYAQVLARGGDEEALYALAVDTLATLHARPAAVTVPPGLPAYERAEMTDTACLLLEWYRPAVMGGPTPPGMVDEFRALWAAPLARLDAAPRTLVLRDFHIDNLMLLADRPGVRACGLLDFQDAGRGAAAYDLVSLLQDARRDIDPDRVARMTARYTAGLAAERRAAFAAECAIAAAQRHCRIIGVFSRLHYRDGKDRYLRHLPRLWRLLEACLGHPELAPLERWLDIHLPKGRRIIPT